MTKNSANPSARKTPSPAGSRENSGRDSAKVTDLPVLFRVPKVRLSSLAPVDPTPKPQPEESISSAPQPTVVWMNKTAAATSTPINSAAPSSAPSVQATPTVPADEVTTTTSPVTEKPSAEKAAPQPAARKVKDAKPAGSWFDNQGKLITVCFLLALTATIYFARSKRQEAEPQPVAADTSPLEVDVPTGDAAAAHEAAPEWQKTEELKVPKRRPGRDVDVARRKAVEAAQAAETAPRAELLPPMDFSAPPLVQSPANETPAANTPPVAPTEIPAPSPTSTTGEVRTAELPADRPSGRSTWGAAELPPPSTTISNPPPAYPAMPAAASPGQTYPATNAAPYRYYLPPGNPAGPSNPQPPGNEPTNERSGSSLY